MIAKEDGRSGREYEDALSRYERDSKRRSERARKVYDDARAKYERRMKVWRSKSRGQRYAPRLFVIAILVAAAAAAGFWNELLSDPDILGEWALAAPSIPAALALMLLLSFPRAPKPPSRKRIEGRLPKPKRPTQAASSSERRVWQAGSEGERRVSEHLSKRLGDEWTLLSGYRGPGGEIDRVLVGPLGVCALEIKYSNGTAFVNGDEWKLDKYDNYGNLVESGTPLEDRGGRSPSAQVNGAVEHLEAFLRERAPRRASRRGGLRISRAVILSHDKSKIGRIRGQTVDHIGTLDGLSVKKLFPGPSANLNAAATSALSKLIQSSHERHDSRRNERSGRARRRRRTV